MNFEEKIFGDRNLGLYKSEAESEISLIFIPGCFNPEIWRQQVNYFSKDFRTVIYRSDGSYEDEKDDLNALLNSNSFSNAVIISHGPGNALAQLVEDNENVIATVMTGVKKNFEVPEKLYRLLSEFSLAKPKIAEKLFFGDAANYATVKQFTKDLEIKSYNDFSSYTQGFALRQPLKDSMIIQPGSSKFSDLDYLSEIKGEAETRQIQNTGLFPFYEKPEEYNKILHDFLQRVEEYVKKKNLRETREENMTLDRYEERSLDHFTEEKVVSTK